MVKRNSDIINIGPMVFNPNMDFSFSQNKIEDECISQIMREHLKELRKSASESGLEKSFTDKALDGVEKVIEAYEACIIANSSLTMFLEIILSLTFLRPEKLSAVRDKFCELALEEFIKK
jgi:hypothetical protein